MPIIHRVLYTFQVVIRSSEPSTGRAKLSEGAHFESWIIHKLNPKGLMLVTHLKSNY